MSTTQQKRPKNLNLLRFHFPVGAIVSMKHRITGALWFLIGPALLAILIYSIHSSQNFSVVWSYWHGYWFVRLFWVLLWSSLAHHFYAGCRFLMLDIHWGVQRLQARRTSWLVLILDVLTLISLGVMWL